MANDDKRIPPKGGSGTAPPKGSSMAESLWIDRALSVQAERDTRRRQLAVSRLHELANRSSIVRAFLSAWQRGNYPTFEDAIASLAVHLAEENARFHEAAVKAMANEVAHFTFEAPRS